MQVAGQHGGCLQPPMATGARVSIAYPTFPPLGDTPLKDGLIPDVVHIWHLTWTKDSSVEDGDASD